MSRRDELAKVLFIADNHNAEDPAREWELVTRHGHPDHTAHYVTMADALIEAGVILPREITTPGEIIALPHGAVMVLANGQAAQIAKYGEDSHYLNFAGSDLSTPLPAGTLAHHEAEALRKLLPATVMER